MSVYAVYFSPTGRTETAARKLAETFGAYETVDLTERGGVSARTFDAGDIVIAAVPAFGGRVPRAALFAMEGWRGAGAQAVLTVTYGNRAYEDTMIELRDFFAAHGFVPIAGVAAVTEHSIMRQFAAGRPDAEDLKKLQTYAERIQEKAARLAEKADACAGEAGARGRKTGAEVGFWEAKKRQETAERADACRDVLLRVPGNVPYKEYHTLPMTPKADKSCTACGLCAAKCPVGAIPSETPGETDAQRCISCMRCVAICPQHARRVNPLVLKAAEMKLAKACAGHKEYELYL